jgi:hypothetical protein
MCHDITCHLVPSLDDGDNDVMLLVGCHRITVVDVYIIHLGNWRMPGWWSSAAAPFSIGLKISLLANPVMYFPVT